MRIIALKTLRQFWEKYPVARIALEAWKRETELASWRSPAELKAQFGSASIITQKRVVFNIKGNEFRLIVDIEYRLQIVFIVWFGSHAEYDLINAKSISYE